MQLSESQYERLKPHFEAIKKMSELDTIFTGAGRELMEAIWVEMGNAEPCSGCGGEKLIMIKTLNQMIKSYPKEP